VGSLFEAISSTRLCGAAALSDNWEETYAHARSALFLKDGTQKYVEVVGDQVDYPPFRDGALYLLEQLYVALGVPQAGGKRGAVLYAQGTEDPHLVRAAAVFQRRFVMRSTSGDHPGTGGKVRGVRWRVGVKLDYP
jgi:hypothetical protein